MATQNDNTILSKADLKAYHQKILPYLGGNYMMSTNNSDYYSTDEKIVGVYMDKPLYQKTILIDTLPNESQANFDTGIANATIDKIVYVFGWTGKKDGTYYRPFPYVYGGSGTDITSLNTIVRLQNAIWIQKNTTTGYWNVYIKTGYDRTVETGAVTIKYTKTTDAAGSATITPGAYDINFPNTWPANTEIFFGNGVYGYRATGNMAITANTVKSWDAVSITRTANTKIYNYGGTWKRSTAIPAAADTVFGIPLSDDPNINSGVIIGSQAIIFTVKDAFTGTAAYDFWVTYTK